MTYDFSNELKKQELENPKDILNICGEGQVTLRKTTDRSSRIQQEYHAMGIIIDDLKKIFKTVPEEEEQREKITDRTAMKKWGTPEDIAGAAVYLASDRASYTTGSTITVDGGYSIT